MVGSAAMNSSCWADCLGNCSQESSQEHVISATVFTDGVLTVKGLRWLNGVERRLPKSRLTAGVLCKRHNELLSPVDAEAGRLSILLRQVATGANPPAYALGGWLLERWCLKVLVNYMFSGWGPGRADTVLCHYVEAVFGIRTLGGGSGLYIPSIVTVGEATDADFCHWAALTDSSDVSRVHGIIISIRHFVMALVLSETATPETVSPLLEDGPGIESFGIGANVSAVHRPKGLTLRGRGPGETQLRLKW
jgi:hypothetical protein